jgi:hypothetical protein
LVLFGAAFIKKEPEAAGVKRLMLPPIVDYSHQQVYFKPSNHQPIDPGFTYPRDSSPAALIEEPNSTIVLLGCQGIYLPTLLLGNEWKC